MMVRISTDLPVPEPPTRPILAAPNGEVQVLVYDQRPNWVFSPLTRMITSRTGSGTAVACCSHRWADHREEDRQHPVKTMINEMLSTTERVVWRPTDSASRCTFRPS